MKSGSKAGTARSGGLVPVQKIVYDWLLEYQLALNTAGSGSEGGNHLTPDGFDAWVTYNLCLLWGNSDKGGPVEYGPLNSAFLRTHPESVLANSVRAFLHDLAGNARNRLALSGLYRVDRMVHGLMALGLIGCLRESDGKKREGTCYVLTFTGRDFSDLVMVPVQTLVDVGEGHFLDVPQEKGTAIAIVAVNQTLRPSTRSKSVCLGHSMNPKDVKNNGGKRKGWMHREEEVDPEFKEPTAQEILDDDYEWKRELAENGKGTTGDAATVTPADGFTMLRTMVKTPGGGPVPTTLLEGAAGCKQKKKKKRSKTSLAPGVITNTAVSDGNSGSVGSSAAITGPAASSSALLPHGDKHGAGIQPVVPSGQGPAKGCAVCAGCSPALISTVKSLQEAKDKRPREILSSLPVINHETPIMVLVETGMLVLQTLKSSPAAYKDFLELAGLQETSARGRLPKVVDTSRDYAFSRQGLHIRNLLDTMRREREETVPAVAPTVPGFCLDDFLAILAPMVESCEHGDLYQVMFQDICKTLDEPLLILLFMKRVSEHPTRGVVNFGLRAVNALNRGMHDFRTFLRYPVVYLRSGLHFDKIKKVFMPLHETPEFLRQYTENMQRTYLTTVKNAEERGLPVCCARFLGKFEVLKHRDFPSFLESYNKIPEVIEYNRRDSWDKFTPRAHMIWQHGMAIPGVVVKTDPL